MKLTLIIAICLLIFNSTFAHEEPSKTKFEQKEKNASRKQIASSQIRKITSTKYIFQKSKLENSGKKILVQEYDCNGNLIALESYKNDSLNLRVEYSFDQNDNMLTDVDFSPYKIMLEKNTYQYDVSGNLLSGKSIDENGNTTGYFLIVKSLDKKTINFLNYKNKDTLDYKILYSYQTDFDSCDYSSAAKYDADNNLVLFVTKKYDAKGHQIEKAIYDEKKMLKYTFYYQFDSLGLQNSITKKKADGKVEWKDIYTYDKNRNCTEINSYDSLGIAAFVLKYEFDYYNYLSSNNGTSINPRVINFNPELSKYQELLSGKKDSSGFYSGVVTVLPKKSGSKHSTEEYEEMIVVLDGQGIVKLSNNQTLELKFGNVAYIPTNTEHQVFNTGDKNLKYIYIAGSTVK